MRVVYSDTNETGYGGYVAEHDPCVVYGQWTSEEAKRSSTWRELAALLSRMIDLDDWCLNPAGFVELNRMWGQYTVNRFASFSNCQLPRFDSQCWNPGSEAVDAFTVDWYGEVHLWCPPTVMIPRVIRHAQV